MKVHDSAFGWVKVSGADYGIWILQTVARQGELGEFKITFSATASHALYHGFFWRI